VTPREGDEALLSVADHGPGLGEQHAAKVFDRFFRVDPARSRDNGGSGLGLAIVAAIVHAHGGTVSVETAAGQGATFVVSIPLAGSPRKVEGPSQKPHRLVP
jgi:two-component system OmpR family sensor kinase